MGLRGGKEPLKCLKIPKETPNTLFDFLGDTHDNVMILGKVGYSVSLSKTLNDTKLPVRDGLSPLLKHNHASATCRIH